MAEVNKRKAEHNKLIALLAKIDAHLTSPLDHAAVVILSERAKEIMDKCEEAHDILVGRCADDAALIVQESAFSPIEATYQDLLTKAKRLLLTLPKPSSSGGSSHTPKSVPVSVRLPEIKPPQFDGQFSNWLSFKDLFTATVHKNKSLGDSEKLYYLKGALQGEPAKLIQSFTTTDGNYTEAWKILDDRYNNEREIVHSLVNKLLNVSAVRTENAVELQSLVDSTVECIRALKVLKRPTDSWGDILVVLIVNKLDPATRREWAIRQTGTGLPTFEELVTFLSSHIRGLNASGIRVSSSNTWGKDKHVRVHQVSTEQTLCLMCNGNHQLHKCSEFLSKSPTARSELTKRLHLCYNCLGRNHHIRNCPAHGACKKCNKRHHTLLHSDQQQPQTSSPATAARGGRSTEKVNNGNVQSHHVSADTRALLKTAVVQVQNRWGEYMPCRVLIDGGSQGDFVSESFATKLGLQRSISNVRVSAFGGSDLGKVKGKINTTLVSKYNDNKLNVELLVLSKLTNIIPNVRCKVENWPHLEGLQLADEKWFLPGGIDITIGTRHFPSVWMQGRHNGPPNTPTAFETVFGWVLCGVTSDEENHAVSSYHVEIDPLYELVKKFFEMEQVPETAELTEEEVAVESHFKENVSRINGRFQVRIPFNEKKKKLGASRATAVRRFYQVERRLQKQPKYKEQYVSFMREYQALGHMTKLSDSTREVIGSTYYLPHHFVVNEDSSTTKLRVVFDGSADTTTGISLNNAMMVGATIQDDLYDHLLRFRLNPVVLKADIAKMFRQFKLHPEDAEYHRIVWREDPSKPLQDFRLETVTYGTASATFLSTRCLHQLALDCADKYPLASAALLKCMYVDDLLATAASSKQAIELYEELDEVMTEAGLDLRKWSSNDSAVLQKIPEAQHEADPHSFDEKGPVKALGMRWHPSGDYFKFKYIEQDMEVVTKRTILKNLCRVFDPLGLISCVVLRARLIIQELWKGGVDWDQPVPDYIQQQWIEYGEDLKSIEQLIIPREITGSQDATYQLCSFSDASELAWGCIIYLRVIMPNGEISVMMVTSKTHVAPTKQISLPRLELGAAASSAKLAHRVRNCLGLNCEMLFWSDSTITLHWIASPARQWKTFVANRVAKIQRYSKVENWFHVAGKENPADLASRGAKIEEIKNNSFWWQGPHWLSAQQLPHFIIPAAAADVDKEEKTTVLKVNAVELDNDILQRFSSLIRLTRVTAYMFRFLHNGMSLIGKSFQRQHGPLSGTELQFATTFWTKETQQHSYGNEISCLKSKKDIKHSSKLSSLHPFVDSSGVLRVSGRLYNSSLPTTSKHQIILPCSSHLAKLIVSHYHLKTMHGGYQSTWAAIQQEYWIVGGREKTRHFVRKCVVCRRYRGRVAEQLMGNLPSQRVTPSRPFLHTGVDYAGPFTLKNPIGVAPKTYKGYMCVFICMSTKAIHLEAVSSLSTEAFMDTLWRFISRRGTPSHIYSDQGSNFLGSEKELSAHIKSPELNNRVAENLATHHITWHFNAPSAPHHGGLWEAAVKSAKYHLRRVIGSNLMTFESFCTILCRIEAVLNSRPLCALSTDPGDLAVLTPGHFIIGEPLNAIPETNLEDVPQNRLTKFQLQQQRVQHFWRRWSKEYLHTLQQRNKWRWEKDNVKVGDLVLLLEETPPSTWKMGRILEVHTGADRHVRKVTLKTSSTVLQRPIVKLVPLLSPDQVD